MLNLDFIYLFINVLLLLIFVKSGIDVSKGRSYVKAAATCIIAFTFAQGCRYMRGNDYAHYLDVFNNRTESDQIVFTWFNDILSWVGIDAYAAFSVYAFVFVTCLMYFLKNYKEYAMYTFPLALIALIGFNEYMIRQALSFSFVFLFVDQLFKLKVCTSPETLEPVADEEDLEEEDEADLETEEELEQTNPEEPEEIEDEEFDEEEDSQKHPLVYVKNILPCFICAFLAYNIHSANIFPIIIILLFWWLGGSKTIPYYVSIPLLIFVAFFFNELVPIDTIAPYFNLLEGANDKFDKYLDNSDYWFGENGNTDIFTRNYYVLILEIWGNCALFWLGDRMSRVLGFKADFAALFNTYIVGTIILVAFRNFEIINRMGIVFALFWFFILGISLFHIQDTKTKLWEKGILVGLVWWAYSFLKYLLMRVDNMTQFLWDK